MTAHIAMVASQLTDSLASDEAVIGKWANIRSEIHDALADVENNAFEQAARKLEAQAEVGSDHVGNALRGAANRVRELKKDLAPLPVDETYPDEDDILEHSKELHRSLGRVLDSMVGIMSQDQPRRQATFEAARLVWTQSPHLRKKYTVPESPRKTILELRKFIEKKWPSDHGELRDVPPLRLLSEIFVFIGVIER